MYNTYATKQKNNPLKSYFDAMKKTEWAWIKNPNEANRQAFIMATRNFNTMKGIAIVKK